MAEFNKLTITNKGQALMSKLIAGTTTIEFTKISTSKQKLLAKNYEKD